MRMSRRAPNIFRQWALLGGLLVLLHVVTFAVWVLFEADLMRSRGSGFIVLMLVYLVLLTVILVVFYRRINSATVPPAYREARESGITATAKVLRIERTRWRVERYRNFRLQVSPRKWEYVMQVRVTPPDGSGAYEAEVADYLHGDDIPAKGDTISVKIHPQQPNVVVFAHK